MNYFLVKGGPGSGRKKEKFNEDSTLNKSNADYVSNLQKVELEHRNKSSNTVPMSELLRDTHIRLTGLWPEDKKQHSGFSAKEIKDIALKSFEGLDVSDNIKSMIEKEEVTVRMTYDAVGYQLMIQHKTETEPHYHFEEKTQPKTILQIAVGFRKEQARHDMFVINSSDASQGVGAKFFSRQEKVFAENGIKKVTLEANIDVGGYAWARMGYKAKNPTDFTNEIESSISSKVSDKDDLDFMLNDLRNPSNGKSNYEPYELATKTYSSPKTKITYNYKNFLLGTNWEGYKNLDEADEGYKVGQLYYESKGINSN